MLTYRQAVGLEHQQEEHKYDKNKKQIINFIMSLFIQLNAQLDCSRNVKTYIKINTKDVPTCFGLTNHHQGAYCCALHNY